MASSWDHLGDLSNVTQLTGLDAVRLIGMIVQAANTARMHKSNCQQFAKHLKLIGNLLEQLKISELKKYPETREPLEQLEDALRRSYILVNSCKDRSYFYLLAMGWNIVYQFRRAQNEIDRYLRIIPLITLVDNARVKQKLENIEKHEVEYTFDEEDKKVQDVILSRDPSVHDPVVLKKTLSCSYPNLPFEKALKKENEKLKMELQRSQNSMDVNQCEVIERLLGLTEIVGKSLSDGKTLKKVESRDSYSSNGKEQECKGSNYSHGDVAHNHGNSRSVSSTSSSRDLISKRGSSRHEDWSMDLLDCCSEPYLCLKTCFYPCGTFSKISTVANNRHISSAEACNDIMAYSLILSCCCYTCCVRRKLRSMLNIEGGCCDDFLSHLICCCCALVQEWREIEIRGAYDKDLGKTMVNAPSFQYMES